MYNPILYIAIYETAKQTTLRVTFGPKCVLTSLYFCNTIKLRCKCYYVNLNRN